MKTRRLVILLSIFALIVIIVVLSSTVFALSKVELSFVEVPTNYDINNSDIIVESGQFDYGSSIFLAKKDMYAQNIEAKFPNIKVINIETCFPNKLVVQVVERQEFLALYNFGIDKYFVVDGDMKVLRVANNVGAINNLAKCVVKQDLIDYKNGDFLKLDKETSVLKDLSTSFWRCGYSEKEMNALVKSISFDNSKNELIISTYCKFRITIKAPELKLVHKLFAGNNAVFSKNGVGEDFVGEIFVYENTSEKKIYANAIINA